MRFQDIRKSDTNRIVTGLCGGLAEAFDMQPWLMRVIWIAVAIGTRFLPALALYIVFSFIIPDRSNQRSVNKQGLLMLIGAALICLGGFIIARRYIPWLDSGIILAVVMVVLGVVILLNGLKK